MRRHRLKFKASLFLMFFVSSLFPYLVRAQRQHLPEPDMALLARYGQNISQVVQSPQMTAQFILEYVKLRSRLFIISKQESLRFPGVVVSKKYLDELFSKYKKISHKDNLRALQAKETQEAIINEYLIAATMLTFSENRSFDLKSYGISYDSSVVRRFQQIDNALDKKVVGPLFDSYLKEKINWVYFELVYGTMGEKTKRNASALKKHYKAVVNDFLTDKVYQGLSWKSNQQVLTSFVAKYFSGVAVPLRTDFSQETINKILGSEVLAKKMAGDFVNNHFVRFSVRKKMILDFEGVPVSKKHYDLAYGRVQGLPLPAIEQSFVNAKKSLNMLNEMLTAAYILDHADNKLMKELMPDLVFNRAVLEQVVQSQEGLFLQPDYNFMKQYLAEKVKLIFVEILHLSTLDVDKSDAINETNRAREVFNQVASSIQLLQPAELKKILSNEDYAFGYVEKLYKSDAPPGVEQQNSLFFIAKAMYNNLSKGIHAQLPVKVKAEMKAQQDVLGINYQKYSMILFIAVAISLTMTFIVLGRKQN